MLLSARLLQLRSELVRSEPSPSASVKTAAAKTAPVEATKLAAAAYAVDQVARSHRNLIKTARAEKAKREALEKAVKLAASGLIGISDVLQAADKLLASTTAQAPPEDAVDPGTTLVSETES